MRNRLKCDVINSGKSGRKSVHQALKFATVALWQMSPRQSNLFLDQIEIVEEPLAGGCDPSIGFGGIIQQRVNTVQYVFVVVEASEQRAGRTFGTSFVGAGKSFAVLPHLIGTESSDLRGSSPPG